VIEGVGKLSFIGLPNFGQQGKLVTFVGQANEGQVIGIHAVNPARFTLSFPQVADGADGTGGGWRTTFILANRSQVDTAATVNFYDDSGKPVEVEVGGQRASQFPLTIPSLGVTRFQTGGRGPLTVGWATVQTDQSLSGIAVFEFLNESGKVVSEVGASATVPLRSMSVFVEAGPSTYTGIALVNPNTVSANVDLILRDSNAKELTRQTLTVPAMGHIAKYAHELFPGVSLPESGGKIEIVSTQALVGLTLRQQGGAFASLPVIP